MEGALGVAATFLWVVSNRGTPSKMAGFFIRME